MYVCICTVWKKRKGKHEIPFALSPITTYGTLFYMQFGETQDLTLSHSQNSLSRLFPSIIHRNEQAHLLGIFEVHNLIVFCLII